MSYDAPTGDYVGVKYTYDPFDRLVKRELDTTAPLLFTDSTFEYFVYDGSDVALRFVDTDGGGSAPPALATRYLNGPAIDQILAEESVDDSESIGTGYMLPDHQGSIRDVTNDAGTVTDHIFYDSYGNADETHPEVQHTYGYAGYFRDPATGFYLTRRPYDPLTGRWISEDWIWDDTNPNRYGRNSPTNLIDSSGLSPTSWGHHFFPAKEVNSIFQYLTDDAAYLALGYSSGPGDPAHSGFHPDYNAAVLQEFEAWRVKNGINAKNKATAEQMKAFIETLFDDPKTGGSPRLTRIREFNLKVNENCASYKGSATRAPFGKAASVETLIARGKQWLRDADVLAELSGRKQRAPRIPRGGQGNLKALLGLALAEGVVTSMATGIYEFGYLSQAQGIQKAGEATAWKERLEIYRALGHFPDGTPFPSDAELAKGTELTFTETFDVHEFDDCLTLPPYKKSTTIYSGVLISRKRHPDGSVRWRLEQRTPDGIRMIIDPLRKPLKP